MNLGLFTIEIYKQFALIYLYMCGVSRFIFEYLADLF